ncbi:MAG: flagellar assembly protein FliW [Chloroflexota bacterium]
MMVTVDTTRFGSLETLEVSEEAIIAFPEGLPGFEDLTEFALIEDQRFWPFTWLQPLAQSQLGFVLMDPALFIPDYQPEISDPELISLETVADDLVELRCILVIPSDPKAATANVKAPILLNRRAQRGKQVILMDDQYALRHPVFSSTSDESLELSASCSS